MATAGRRRVDELVNDLEAKNAEWNSFVAKAIENQDLLGKRSDELNSKVAELDTIKAHLLEKVEQSGKIHESSLKNYSDQLTAKIAEIDQSISQIAGDLATSTNTLQQINLTGTTVTKFAGQIEQLLSTANASTEKISNLSQKSSTVEERIQKYEKSLSDAQNRQETLLQTVESLLPGAASAGLASAFSKQKDVYKGSIKFWTVVRFIAVGLILGYGAFVYKDFSSSMTQIQQNALWDITLTSLVWLVNKSPILLALILFEEFARRSYNRHFKLQEDYAYKQVVSQSFEGYKKQLLELGADQGTNSALNSLCENTVKALAESPIRLLNEEKDTGGRRWFNLGFRKDASTTERKPQA